MHSERYARTLHRRQTTRTSMVVAGHGLGWMPESCVEREIAEKRLVVAGDSQWRSPLEIRLYRAADCSNEFIDRLWAFLLTSHAGTSN
ncbi:Transcriptional regulator LysR [Herbaspirillum rubrisubalbicans M1]|nr:Transcriptional regulator LysR [Herbaspirillum rubrisubalbicans M1]